MTDLADSIKKMFAPKKRVTVKRGLSKTLEPLSHLDGYDPLRAAAENRILSQDTTLMNQVSEKPVNQVAAKANK